MSDTGALRSFVVDTSVAVKWFVQRGESDLARAVQLFEASNQGRCILKAPQLLLFEIANALRISHKLPLAEVLEALDALRQLKLDVQDFSWSTLAKATQIAAACDATVYDTYFLALAFETGSILVTADEVFLRKTRRYPGIVPLRQLRLPD